MSNPRGVYRGTKILIADDDGVSRLFCSQSLARAGAHIHEAASGDAALRMAAAHVPDIVIVDAHLPDMSGKDVIEVIRKEWPCSLAPPTFIGITGDDSAATTSLLRAAGCDSILTKPFLSQALAACVLKACGMDSRPGTSALMPPEPQAGQQLQEKFSVSLASQLAELDGAMTRLDWETVRRLVHGLSGAAAFAGHGKLAQTGRNLLRSLPPAGSAARVADAYAFFLHRVAEVARR